MALECSIRLRIPIVNKQRMEIVFTALSPETRTLATRANTTLRKGNGLLILNVKAKDSVALRAVSNAYLRWINSLINVLNILEAQIAD
jgi:tRNA threonylcarbamoyladenosine modification (KEOPS) complex  Pcc1 subunit